MATVLAFMAGPFVEVVGRRIGGADTLARDNDVYPHGLRSGKPAYVAGSIWQQRASSPAKIQARYNHLLGKISRLVAQGGHIKPDVTLQAFRAPVENGRFRLPAREPFEQGDAKTLAARRANLRPASLLPPDDQRR